MNIIDYTNDDVDPNGKPCARNRFRKMEEAVKKFFHLHNHMVNVVLKYCTEHVLHGRFI